MRTRTNIWWIVGAMALLFVGIAAWVVMPHNSEHWESPEPKSPDTAMVGRVLVVEGHRGFRIGNRGLTMTYTRRSPELKVKTPLGEAVCKLLADENRVYVMEDDTVTWQDVWELMKEPMGPNQWERDVTTTVVTADTKLVSMLQIDWQYTGGAHGMSEPFGRNFVEIDGAEHELRLLDELFTPNTDWLAVLAKNVEADLREQGASFIDEALPFDDTKLGRFTIGVAGLQIHFPPYAVGSYAEGMFTVVEPWAKLRKFMRKNAAVTKWVDEQAEMSRSVSNR